MVRNGLPFVLMFLSGFAGLGYEIIWTRMLSASLGHEIIAVLAVVAAFFSGLAIGSWALDRPLSVAEKPGRWYAGLEFVIGLWALVLSFAFPWANHLALGLGGHRSGSGPPLGCGLFISVYYAAPRHLCHGRHASGHGETAFASVPGRRDGGRALCRQHLRCRGRDPGRHLLDHAGAGV